MVEASLLMSQKLMKSCRLFFLQEHHIQALQSAYRHLGVTNVHPNKKTSKYLKYGVFLTILMLSLAAKATTSAHETIPLHAASSLVFALSMTSKPLKLGLFAGESFSAVFEGVESISTDPSQPYISGN